MAWKLPPDQDAMGGVLGGGQDMPLWLQSGMEQAPTAQQQRHWKLLDPFNMPRVQGIGEAIASALLPRRDEQGMYQAPGIGDAINAALWVVPGMRGPRSGSNTHATVQPSMAGDALLTAMRRSPGGPPEPQNIATSRKAQATELKSRWEKSGPQYDEADFMETPRGDKLWGKEVRAWNKEFGTNFDPNNMPIDASTQGIVERYRMKYIGDQKVKFPGVEGANDHFSNNSEPQNIIHLRGKDQLGSGEGTWREGRMGGSLPPPSTSPQPPSNWINELRQLVQRPEGVKPQASPPSNWLNDLLNLK